MAVIPLTPKRIATLSTTRTQEDFIDKKFKAGSFGVRVYQSGKKKFFIRYKTKNGRDRWLTLGNALVVPLGEARKEALCVLADVHRGHDPADEKRCRGSRMTVGELADEFLSQYVAASLTAGTLYEYRGVINKHIRPKLGSLPLRALETRDIVALLYQLGTKEQKPGLANRVRCVLQSMSGYALETGLLASNPCIGLRQGYPRKVRGRILSDAELIAFWRETEVEKPWHRDYLRLLLLTALRPGELANLEWSHFQDDILTIPAALMKNRRPHRLPLPRKVLRIFEARRDSHPTRVFPHYSSVSKHRQALRRPLIRRMGVESFSAYDLRRTCATHLERLGVKEQVIGAVLSHAKSMRIHATAAYARYSYQHEKLDALTRWADRVFDLVGGRRPPQPFSKGISETVPC